MLALLHPLASGGWLAPRCTNLALQFVTAAVEEKAGYAALKPHIDGLLLHVVLPMLSFNDDDSELWADDPAEFVRKVGEGRALGCVCIRLDLLRCDVLGRVLVPAELAAAALASRHSPQTSAPSPTDQRPCKTPRNISAILNPNCEPPQPPSP